MKSAPVQAESSISAHGLHRLRESGGAPCVLDVRTPPEYSAAHITGTTLLPLDEISRERLAALRLAPDSPIHVICQSGRRAARAIDRLRSLGFTNCVLVDGGVEAWSAAGLPLERGKSKVLPLTRQVQLVIGGSTVLGAALALTVDPLFAWIPAITGCGLLINGLTGWCGLALFMARMPWNREPGCCKGGCC